MIFHLEFRNKMYLLGNFKWIDNLISILLFEAWKSPVNPKLEPFVFGCLGYKRRTHICSEGQNGGICNGDSGGPLFCLSNNKEKVQIWFLS